MIEIAKTLIICQNLRKNLSFPLLPSHVFIPEVKKDFRSVSELNRTEPTVWVLIKFEILD